MKPGYIQNETPEKWGNMFESEEDFLSALDKHDRLIRQCADGIVSFQDFLVKYEYFYGYYALDGHESDESELRMFEKYEERIKPHEELGTEIFLQLCDDNDALKDSYIKAGRFGSDEGLRRLRIVSKKYFCKEDQL